VPLPLRRVVVSGPSMAPTLHADDVLLVRWRPGRITPAVGDVVVVDLPGGRPLSVKRVTAITPDGLRIEGDNPSGSTDSRDFGAVAVAAVRGRVLFRLWPRPGRLARCAQPPR